MNKHGTVQKVMVLFTRTVQLHIIILHYKIISVSNTSLPLLQCRRSCHLHDKINNVWNTSLPLLQCRRSYANCITKWLMFEIHHCHYCSVDAHANYITKYLMFEVHHCHYCSVDAHANIYAVLLLCCLAMW